MTLKDVSYGLQNTSIEVLDYSKVNETFGTSKELKGCDLWYLNNTNVKELHMNSNRMASIEVNGLHLMQRSLEVFRAESNYWEYGPYLFQTGCVNNLKIIEASKKLFVPLMRNYRLKRNTIPYTKLMLVKFHQKAKEKIVRFLLTKN